MKQKSIFLALLIGMISLCACSDDETFEGGNVPDKVQQEFNTRFPNVQNVKWDIVKNYHVARFNAPATKSKDSQYNTNAWFTNEGRFCQTDEDMDFADLPILAQESFTAYKNKFYADWEIDDCEMLAREGMAAVFVIELEKGDLEREISISESGDILKDVLDDDDEDEILPILIPEELNAILQEIFPDTHSTLSILELEIDDDELEIDVIEGNRHKEIKLNAQYELVSIEYEISFEEAQHLMPVTVFQNILELAKQAGIDLLDEQLQEKMEIEVKETANGYAFEVEIEINDTEFEIQIDEEGNIKIED